MLHTPCSGGAKSAGTLRNGSRLLKVPSLPFKGTSLQEVNLRGNKHSNKNNRELGAFLCPGVGCRSPSRLREAFGNGTCQILLTPAAEALPL